MSKVSASLSTRYHPFRPDSRTWSNEPQRDVSLGAREDSARDDLRFERGAALAGERWRRMRN